MKNVKLNSLFSVIIAAGVLVGCGSNDFDEPQGGTLTGLEENAPGSEGGLYVEMDEGQSAEDLDNAEVLYQEQPVDKPGPLVVYFAFDQATLTEESRSALDAKIAYLKNTSGTIRIEGHTDERGTREYNVALGERRAQAVADYMALYGVPRYRLETVSYGEERPVAFGQEESSWAQNRRVELK